MTVVSDAWAAGKVEALHGNVAQTSPNANTYLTTARAATLDKAACSAGRFRSLRTVGVAQDRAAKMR